MRFIERHDVVRASFVLLLPLFAAINGCGGDVPIGSDAGGAGGGGAAGSPALVAVLEDATLYDSPMWELNNDRLKVFDVANPNLPLLELSGLKLWGALGSSRNVATSKSKKRLGVLDMARPPTLRIFDENLQPLVNVVLPDEGYGTAVCPTEQAIFVLYNHGTINSGNIVKLDSNGSYVGITIEAHGMDLIVDEDHQVIWTVGQYLTRATTDLANEQVLHEFGYAAVSLDLDANGGIWAAEWGHSQVEGSVYQLVHFDVNGKIISSDTLPLPGTPMSVRVDRNSGLVWVAMFEGGVVYRDTNGQLEAVPGLTGMWTAVEPDPLDGSSVWAAGRTKQVVHVDTNGTLIQSLEGFSIFNKWLAVMPKRP
jgi:hypothetical protein